MKKLGWLILFSVFLAFVNNSFALDVPKLVNLTFGAIDLKYNPGQVKILEFGVGERAGMSAIDKLVEMGLGENSDRMWTRSWKEIKKLNIPVWCVHGRIGSLRYAGKASLFYEKDFATFQRYGWGLVSSLDELVGDALFQQLVKKQHPETKKQVSDFKGIIIIDHHCYMNEYHKILSCDECARIAAFKKQHADFLFLNDETGYFLRNKHVTHTLFAGDPLLEFYRPRSMRCHNVYTSELAAMINKQIQNPIVVVKPIGSGLGRGVVITEKEKLDKVLAEILNKKNETDDTWKNYIKLPEFIVEGYEPSKFITVGGKQFDATMRVLFFLIYENGKTRIKFLGSCWQLPDYDVLAKVSLTNKHKNSYAHEATRLCTVPVSEQDQEEVCRLLTPCLAHACEKALQLGTSLDGAFFKAASLYRPAV